MPTPDVQIEATGPYFRQGGGPVRGAIRETVMDLLVKGEREVKLQLYPGHGLVSGHYRRSVHGEPTSDLQGRIHDSRVVYGPWLEGVGSRNERSRFKGYRMFHNAKQKLESLKMQVLQRAIHRAVRRLN